MKCKEPHKDLLAYAEEILSEERQAEVEEHLKECNSCLVFLEELKGYLEIIEEEKGVEVNPFLLTRIESKITNQNNERSWIRRSLIPNLVGSVVMAAGIYFGVVFGSNYSLGGNNNDTYYEASLYIDDLGQEPIETYFLEIKNPGDE